MAIGYPKDWVSKRTTLEESRSESKAVRRGGVDGSKYDFPHGSTGRSHINEIDREGKGVAPSLAPRTRGHIGPPRINVAGHAPDGSGRWIPPTHDKELIGNAIATHPRLEPQGQGFSASGGKHGKVSKVPAGKDESYRHRADAGALAGDSRGGRPSYTGGKGRIQP